MNVPTFRNTSNNTDGVPMDLVGEKLISPFGAITFKVPRRRGTTRTSLLPASFRTTRYDEIMRIVRRRRRGQQARQEQDRRSEEISADANDGSNHGVRSEGEGDSVIELQSFSEIEEEENFWFRLWCSGVRPFHESCWEDVMETASNFTRVTTELLSVTDRYEDKFELRRAHLFSKVLWQLLDSTATKNNELLDSDISFVPGTRPGIPGVPGFTYYYVSGKSEEVRVSLMWEMRNGERVLSPTFDFISYSYSSQNRKEERHDER